MPPLPCCLVMCADPSRSGARYWYYSMNELGMEDIAAQVGTWVPPAQKRDSCYARLQCWL